jgi:hypothetical protein
MDHRITYRDGFGIAHPYYDEKLKRNRFEREEALKLAKAMVPNHATSAEVFDSKGESVRIFGRGA